jgi:Transglycosylase-like domain
MRLLLAALALTASSHQGPGPGLSDAVWMASVTRWNQAVAWSYTVAAQEAQRRRNSRTITYTTGASNTAARTANPSQSPTSSSWDSVAACESGGDWNINTGNGYYGGLQMNMAFWHAHGGDQYAVRPDLASRGEQIAVAEQAGSRTPWPMCGSR